MRCPIVACILAGGEGTRLLPLTIDRTKPAVRFYRGTADAVYQNLALLKCIDPAHVLILGGDHVYHMDYRYLLRFHQARGADVTMAIFPVPRHQASRFGIVTADSRGVGVLAAHMMFAMDPRRWRMSA